jgi:hypothetical protein
MAKVKPLVALGETREEYIESGTKEWYVWSNGYSDEEAIRDGITTMWDTVIQPMINNNKAYFSKEVKERTAKRKRK